MDPCDHASAKHVLLPGHETRSTLPTPRGRASGCQVAPALLVETITAPGQELGGMLNGPRGPPAEAQQSELVGHDREGAAAAAGRPWPLAMDQCRPPSVVTPSQDARAPVGFGSPITMQSEALPHESKAAGPTKPG